jgi:uncharacterized repeat protein (TIGR03809 family)
MDYHIGTFRTEEIARKWMLLAERRRDHLEELHRTGRWRKYFSEDKLISLKRATERTIQEWHALAAPAITDLAPEVTLAADAPNMPEPEQAAVEPTDLDHATA